jgi:hypothetical protein
MCRLHKGAVQKHYRLSKNSAAFQEKIAKDNVI